MIIESVRDFVDPQCQAIRALGISEQDNITEVSAVEVVSKKPSASRNGIMS